MRSHLAGIANYSGETYSDKRRLTRNLKLSRYHHPILIEDRGVGAWLLVQVSL